MKNYYIQWTFYLYAMVAILAYRLSYRFLPPMLRKVLLVGMSLGFITLLAEAKEFLEPLTAYVAIVVSLGIAMTATSTGFKRLFFHLGVWGSVILLILVKYPAYIDWIWHPAPGTTQAWIGLSYLVFRAIDFCIVVRASKVESYSPMGAAAYLLFFPSYISGPINRYADFVADTGRELSPMTFERMRRNLCRIAVGVIKILFLSQIAYYNSVACPQFQALMPVSGWNLTVGMYCYLLYIYLDFSGYCDAAIAVADFFDIRLPENFNWPLFSSSIQDFWNRWHMSLSYWCRDHVFFPLSMYLYIKKPWVPHLVASCCSIFVTFLVIGAWHGSALHWSLYGAYHGCGMVAYQIYKHVMKSRFPDTNTFLEGSRVFRVLCCLVTFNFVSWGLLLTLGFDQAVALLGL